MYENLKIEIVRLILIISFVLLFGKLTGLWLFTGFVFFIGYFIWHLRQVYFLERWMLGFDKNASEKLTGIWQYAAESISRYQKTGKKRKRRIARLLNRFNTTLELLPDAIIVTDTKNRIEWLNQPTSKLLGITRKDIERPLLNILKSSSLKDVFKNKNFEQSIEMPSPVNAGVELEVKVIPFGDGQYLVTAHDITELKKIESIRREFLANVSHELRTPLTVINGYLEMLEQDDLPEEYKAGIIASARQAARMQTLVSDLLMLSRIEMHGDASLIEEAVNIPRMLKGLQEDAIRLSERGEHNIRLQLDRTVGMTGSEAELASAFGNLMFNAVLHTPPATNIVIWWQKKTDHLEFRVVDDGPGIEGKHLARLTERFYRVDKARSRERGGTGLGLSIVRHVVQRHGGEVKISSRLGKGTTFTIVFPLERALELKSAV